MNTEPPDTRFQALLLDARHAQRQGARDAASRWERVLAAAPGHPEALVQLAQMELVGGNHEAARERLTTALKQDPGLSLAHAYMARVHVVDGDLQAAVESLDLAVRHDASAWAARIEKAQLLETLGRQRDAALAWGAALSHMPREAMEAHQMREMVAHGRSLVQADRIRLREHLEARTAALRAGESRRHLDRFEHGLDIATGRRPFVTAKPLMLPIPGLPAIMFFEREDFDWAPAVEAATADIIEELARVAERDATGFEPYVQTRPGEAAAQFAKLDRNPDWGAYFLWKHGQRIEAHCQQCPATAAAVEHAPLVHIRSRAPAVLFSRLQPGVHIPPHNGATNSRLTVHLPLVIPEGCGFRVGDEVRVWKPGELLIFDDTIRHEAWNHSDTTRTVLIFDIWHPMLTPLERELVTMTVEGMADYYDGADELGEL